MSAPQRFAHRPRSSSCPKGAWFSSHYHTSWHDGEWVVYESGIGPIVYCRTLDEAKAEMTRLESERPK